MIRLHEDSELFREAVSLTVAETAYSARLIEKDYFCSVFLEHFTSKFGKHLIFKGGTCLTKVHADFYRMSEDLDFAIPMAMNSSRSERSKQLIEPKKAFLTVPKSLSCFHLVEPLQGANDSSQYIGNIGYVSVFDGQMKNIKIEISLREPILTSTSMGKARTILLDPISGTAAVPLVSVHSLSMKEAIAEKFRAALTRREVAIRDFFDLDYVIRQRGVRTDDTELIKLVKKKLKVPGNDSVDIGKDRFLELRRQIDTRLKPVLRESDFSEFNLDRAFKLVSRMAQLVS